MSSEISKWQLFRWKAEDFWDDFIESWEILGRDFVELLKNPYMLLLLFWCFVAFVISAIGTWLWGW